jgi:23S rRNA (uracil1939-C5)-methyltransferase
MRVINVELKIEKMVYGGSGLARINNDKVVLIPFTLPGETVTAENLIEKNGIQTGIPKLITQKSAQRLTPPCPYYTQCGGCHYQHIEYAYQLEIKQSILCEQLERLGNISHPPIEKTVPSPNMFGYRNHVQFHLDTAGKPGFQKAQSHDVIAVDQCMILETPLNALVQSLIFEPDSGLTRIAIRDDGQGTPLLYMSGETNNPPEFEVDFPLNVVYRGPAGEMSLSGDDINVFEILEKEFQVSAGSFFQTNREIAEKMVKYLSDKVHLTKNSTVLDCYCGVGFFSAFLAEKAGKLIGIESSESACNDFVVNLDQFDQVELYEGNVEVILPALDIHPDLAVIDPPRAGIAPAAMKALIKACPAQLVYVSCDPSTLARDLKTLVSTGYQIDSITPFDMFPQSYHIETMVFLIAKGN